MADWTDIPEEVRKELVERLRVLRRKSWVNSSDNVFVLIDALIAELDPPPLSDADKLEAIREAWREGRVKVEGGEKAGLVVAILDERRPQKGK